MRSYYCTVDDAKVGLHVHVVLYKVSEYRSTKALKSVLRIGQGQHSVVRVSIKVRVVIRHKFHLRVTSSICNLPQLHGALDKQHFNRGDSRWCSSRALKNMGFQNWRDWKNINQRIIILSAVGNKIYNIYYIYTVPHKTHQNTSQKSSIKLSQLQLGSSLS